MLSFEERFALLEKALAKTTQEELYEELSSYEAHGPLAFSYLEKTKYIAKDCYPIPLNDFGGITTKIIHYFDKDQEPNIISSNNEKLDNDIALAA